MTSKRARLPRHQRVKDPPRMYVKDRDREIMRAVHEFRVLQRQQIQRLFGLPRSTANRVLLRLFQHRFLDRRLLPVVFKEGDAQALYLLGERGAIEVAEMFGVEREEVSWRPYHNEVGIRFLEHRLALNDVRIAMTLAAAQHGWRISQWIDEEEFKSQNMKDYVLVKWEDRLGKTRSKRLAVVPDGYCVLNLGETELRFFLEVDMSSEYSKVWSDKVKAYIRYVLSGQYGKRYGAESIRVLTVAAKSKRRRDILTETTENAGGKRIFWFAYLGEVKGQDVFGDAIWRKASERGFHTLIR